MTLPALCRVLGNVSNIGLEPAEGTLIRFVSEPNEVRRANNVVVVPEPYVVTVPASGDIDISVLPGRYAIVTGQGTTSYKRFFVTVPEAATSYLAQLIDAPPPATLDAAQLAVLDAQAARDDANEAAAAADVDRIAAQAARTGAEAAQDAAEASEASAASSATAALASKNAAAASETAAAASASSASGSAATATAQATAAGTARAGAEAARDAASTSATASATSASASASSASAAASSAATAQAARDAALVAETAAELAQSGAETSAAAAASSASAASSSASAAAGSAAAADADSAATAADRVATGNDRAAAELYASQASASKDAAATSAANAATSASAAASARTGAESARDTAVSAKTSSEAARDAAIVARNAAQTAETNAETAEAGAVSAKAAADTYRDQAATSAGQASASAAAASLSASGAATSASNADADRIAAETAKTAAEAARDSAQGSATTATTKASEASASAAAAAASETAAAGSATAAAISAQTIEDTYGALGDIFTARDEAVASADAAEGSADAALLQAQSAAQSALIASQYSVASGLDTATRNAQAAASVAQGHAASASSVVQQDLSGITAQALHRSPNAITAMAILDGSKSSDGGAWTEKCQHTSWWNEAINGKWLGAADSEFQARYSGSTVGAELISNGGFDTDTVWGKSVFGSAPAPTIANGVGILPRVNSSNFAHLGQSITGPAGVYRVTVTAPVTVRVRAGTGSLNGSYLDANFTGTQTLYFVATAANPVIAIFSNVDGVTATVDNVSVRQVTAITTASGDYYQSSADGRFYRLWKNLLSFSTPQNVAAWTGNTSDFGATTAVTFGAAGAVFDGAASKLARTLGGLPGFAAALSFTVKSVSNQTVTFSYRNPAGGNAVISYNPTTKTASITSGSQFSAPVVQTISADTARIILPFAVLTGANCQFMLTGGGAGDTFSDFQWEPGSSFTSFEAKGADGSITEVFRGNKRDFPRLAGIVAEAGNVNIYDLTEPGRPLWRRFITSANEVVVAAPTSIAAMNSTIAVGTTGGLILIDFAKDSANRLTTGADAMYRAPLSVSAAGWA